MRTKISPTRNPCAFPLLLSAALALNGETLRASENPEPIAAPAAAIDSAYEEIGRLDSGIAPASDQANGLRHLMAYNPSVGACGDIELGPLKEAEYTGKEAWLSLIETECPLEALPRELLRRDDVWTYLRNLCSELPTKDQLVPARTDEDWKIARDGIPRACGLLSFVYPRPAASLATATSSPPQTAARSPATVRANNDRLTLDTTVVTGNRELPKVLYIVPWKKSDLSELPSQPFNTLLDEALTPLDRDVFRREVEYYGAVSGAAADDAVSR